MRALVAAAIFISASAHARELAITIDDFDTSDTTQLDGDQRNTAILEALAKHKVRAALFVSCHRLRGPDDLRRLAQWARAGHIIANHSWSHTYFGAKQSAADEIADIARCDAMLAKLPGYVKRFRYPYLAEGDTQAKRDKVHAWLRKAGFRSGGVTIDSSDWFIDRRLRDRYARDPNADGRPVRDFYVRHMLDRAEYYDGLAREVLGREVKHTLLMHFNLLSALYLDDLLTRLEQNGWRLIDAPKAFEDPVFAAHVDVMPSGQSIIWAHAKKAGKDMRFPGEDGDYEKAALDAIAP